MIDFSSPISTSVREEIYWKFACHLSSVVPRRQHFSVEKSQKFVRSKNRRRNKSRERNWYFHLTWNIFTDDLFIKLKTEDSVMNHSNHLRVTFVSARLIRNCWLESNWVDLRVSCRHCDSHAISIAGDIISVKSQTVNGRYVFLRVEREWNVHTDGNERFQPLGSVCQFKRLVFSWSKSGVSKVNTCS